MKMKKSVNVLFVEATLSKENLLVKDASMVLSLGVTCKYCAKCEFIIAHRHELEYQLSIAFDKIDPTKIGNDYFVVGTIERNVWKKGLTRPQLLGSIRDSLADFKKHLTIEVTPARWTSA